MLKTDSYFEIGSTHDVCQDFALSGNINDKISYAIITDGCTQSHKACKEVDFGARIVAYAARESIKRLCEQYKNLTVLENNRGENSRFSTIRNELFLDIKAKIQEIRKSFNLSPFYADCTLLAVITDGNIAYVYVFGDGGIIVKNKDDSIIYDEISYLSSAPFYLSYFLDNLREAQYKNEFGNSPVIHSNYIIPFDKDIEDAVTTYRQAKQIDYSIYDFSSFIYDNFKSITITSDGIKSFQALENENKDVNVLSMAVRFINFRSSNNNVFLQRRMLMLKRENLLAKVSHYDDISAASILVNN